MQELRGPPTGISNESRQTTAGTWKWFSLMDEGMVGGHQFLHASLPQPGERSLPPPNGHHLIQCYLRLKVKPIDQEERSGPRPIARHHPSSAGKVRGEGRGEGKER